MSTRPLLTVQQVAERLNFHHSFVRRLIGAGKLQASKLGAEWRIDPDDLDAFLARHRNTKPEPVIPDSERLPVIPESERVFG